MLNKQNVFLLWLIGLMSGFTLMITSSALNFWLAVEKIDIHTIGIFAVVTLPYALNFIWAPIFDAVDLPIFSKVFGRRVSWVIIIQILISMVIYLMSLYSLKEDIIKVGITAVVVAFLTSSQDAALGGIKTELIRKQDQISVSGIYVVGYRVGMLISGSGSMIISHYISWSSIYKLFALIVLCFAGLLITLSNKITVNSTALNKKVNSNNIPKNKKPYIVSYIIKQIINPIEKPLYVLVILIFLVLYKLPDNFIYTMINPFLLHVGYDPITIGTAGKLFGTIASLLGGLVGGYIIRKYNVFDSLLIFGIVHAFAHIMFIVQDVYGKNLYLLFTIIGAESISGGITMSIYIAFITMLCNGKFRSTQYAFFSSMMGLSRSIFPTLSGYIVSTFQWKIFFLFTTIATVPSLVMIFYLKKLYNHNNKHIL